MTEETTKENNKFIKNTTKMSTKQNLIVKSLATAVCIAGLFTGCERKQPDNPDTPSAEGVPAYMSISVSLPSAGNAYHAPFMSQQAPYGGDTIEVGSEAENTVKEVLLVLADNENNYCLHATAPNNTTSANLNVTAKFNQTDIVSTFYENEADGGSLKETYTDGIRVFVFCNPTAHLKNELRNAKNAADKKAWVNLVCSQASFSNTKFDRNSPVWAPGTFLMSNYSIAERELPYSLSDWLQYNTPSRAFNLSTDNGGAVNNSSANGRGAIKVERSVARLDFRDGSGNNNTYAISEADGRNLMKVQLVKMCLVNMSNSFYYLRHMAASRADGAAGSSITLLDEETASNYVMDVDENAKRSDINTASLQNMFEYPLFNSQGKINETVRNKWDNWYVTDVLQHDEDDNGYNKDGYHVWRYVTENTIPDPAQQKVAISTGVVFKGKLQAGDDLDADDDLYKAINGGYDKTNDYCYNQQYPILFLFQNQLYVGFNNGVVSSIAEDDQTSALYRAVYEEQTIAGETEAHSPLFYYNALMNALEANTGVANALANFRKAATAAGFTLYEASTGDHDGDGYYFYYYYWIRHRNNGDNQTMGPMEFATVRNNVYKLAVTRISKIGYPRNPDNDPDPIDPDDPDESSERYITVEIEVLPWVVRENNIEF